MMTRLEEIVKEIDKIQAELDTMKLKSWKDAYKFMALSDARRQLINELETLADPHTYDNFLLKLLKH